MELREFLWSVVTSDSGWLCIAHAKANATSKSKKGYVQEWFGWPDDIDAIIKKVDALKADNEVYFSPYLFTEKNTHKQYVVDSKTIVADLDEANVLTLPFTPTVLVESSPERHQGYWILRDPSDSMDHHEELAQRLTYAIPRCDRTGWFIGKFLRVPGTFNHKYVSGPKLVSVLPSDAQLKYNPLEFEHLPKVPSSISLTEELDSSWIEDAEALDIGPQELLATLQTKLPQRIVATYDVEAQDRSAALWALMTNAFRQGCTKEQVYVLANGSANNKFSDLKRGGKEQLAKDVLRAEQAVKNPKSDIREKISEARRLKGTLLEKRMYLTVLVRDHLQKQGQFIHCADDSLWYVRSDTGRPISLSMRSEHFNVMLDTVFGINSTEPECNFIKSSIISAVSDMPPSGIVGQMSYYDTETDQLLLHNGRREVLVITKASIKNEINGYNGVVFPWQIRAKLLEPTKGSLDNPWYEEMYSDCLDNLIDMRKENAMAILRVWTIMIVLRNGVVSRPILTLLGQPGSGKSTLFRRVYTMLYGEQRSLNSITSAEDFDFSIATDPLVVFDNVDTWERWLPDKLAISVTNSEMTRRKLYTDSETVTLSRQAIIGLTAHNPRFGREDVADRLLILNFERLPYFKSESEILFNIIKNRNSIWGEIVKDIQIVFQTSMPTASEIPQFRVEDFARMGYWIAKALRIGQQFKSAISSIKREQQVFSLMDDQLLVDGLNKMVKRVKPDAPFRSAGELWASFETTVDDVPNFRRRYKSASALGRKLWSLQEALRSLYSVEFIFDSSTGARKWKFLPLEGDTDGGTQGISSDGESRKNGHAGDASSS